MLDHLEKQDLGEFYVNPLTLTLVAEIVTAGQGLPKGRAELFESASKLLTSERNPLHQRSKTAQSSPEVLLESAGAIFTHLLLSGTLGVSDRPWDGLPEGYVQAAELDDIPGAPLVREVIKTRLFQSPDENLYIPFHRIIAEFLGARWLSRRLSNGLSERRAFQTLTSNGGIPTAFRGLHAWLAHFCPHLAPRCIKTDPYGVLRYGETDRFSVHQARILLQSLASLAEEDPYFRDEDWGRRAISGLARAELKNEVVKIVTDPARHLHLSMLILEALQRSELAKTIAPQLQSILESPLAIYAERSSAVEALIESSSDTDWPTVVEKLRVRGATGDARLALEIIASTCGTGLSAKQIAEAIIEYERRDEEDEDAAEDLYVSGMTYGIVRSVSANLAGSILDEMSDRFKSKNWRTNFELTSSINQLIEKAIRSDELPSPERAWSWLTLAEAESGYYSGRKPAVDEWLIRNPALRRQIQTQVIGSGMSKEGTWIAIMHDLPQASRALAISATDAAEMLTQLGEKSLLSDGDIVLWADLVRSQQSTEGFPPDLGAAANLGVERHSRLAERWDEITAPPKRNWKQEEEKRRSHQEEEREKRFADHRAEFLPRIAEIEAGNDLASLVSIARAYLGMYSDLDRGNTPQERIRIWLGNELTNAALAGFVSALARKDMPSAQQISETHVEGKYKNIELVLVSGVSEVVRTERSLEKISPTIASAVLASFWDSAAFDSKRVDESVQELLESKVLTSESSTEKFLRSVVEPHIRAGHEHVPGLHRIAQESRFSSLAGSLSIRWLNDYRSANTYVQTSLIRMALARGKQFDLRTLARQFVSDQDSHEIGTQRLWICVSFLVDFEVSKKVWTEYFLADKTYIWTLQELQAHRRSEENAKSILTIGQRETIVQSFGMAWPVVDRPSSTTGNNNPWDATGFIRFNIRAISSDPTQIAADILERLSSSDIAPSYRDDIKHARAQQLRLRRDSDFHLPSFGEIKNTLADKLPANIDDLKAVLLDRLETVQTYIRSGDTSAWEAYWNKDTPKDENTCRNRLLDQLRDKVPAGINFLPEVTMPDATRADIVATYLGYGVPMEIKGQWHPDVWGAASVQLIEKYAHDWRADDRGIYLVLWFGRVAKKNLPKHPEGLAAPKTSSDLREMLIAGLSPTERTRIDVFVLDFDTSKR
ncbi:hypothetical protein [Bradyrhizobium sp. 62]|uniref:hypothetical protein n=1 Tax=Bradyrhizobium sp. 62 TaxID=1043588 RepID=UPI001FF722F5|nr:hypothetical protein [Bradyrhizobium sp. 62]MCK1367057.1 hypothetical protein [Bradyrhizobium sp. 62]